VFRLQEILMTHLIRQIGVGVGVLGLLGATIQASAEERYVIEELVVTAQKRSELLQEVPVAVTALSGQALADMGAQGFMDYARFLPSLSMQTRGDGNSTMQVRGVSPPGFGTQATTAVYFDEIPVGSQFGQPDLPLIDIDRVELLRGPQGTLFGEGSIGGTLRLISNKPQLDEFTFSVTGEASQTSGGGDNFGTSAVLNVPLGDYAAVRASGLGTQPGRLDRQHVGSRAEPAEKVGGLGAHQLREHQLARSLHGKGGADGGADGQVDHRPRLLAHVYRWRRRRRGSERRGATCRRVSSRT
jgi:outer membrane receptor protein involved in Fe transport